MPLIPIIIGATSLLGGVTAFNFFDDNVVDPLSGESDRPLISDRVAIGLALAAVGYVVFRQVKR